MEDMMRNFNLDLLGTPQVKNRDNKKNPKDSKKQWLNVF